MFIKLFPTTISLVLLSSAAIIVPELAQAQVRTQSPAPSTQQRSTPAIESFTVQPVQQLGPGTELIFTLLGTPNAEASFSIEGVAFDQPMQEIAPGTYRGEYVIRRQDYFPAEGTNVVASLQSQGQTLRARLDQPLAASSGATPNSRNTGTVSRVPLEIISPENNSQVSGTVKVTGRSAPNATVNVSVKATNSLAGVVGINRDILNQTVETDAQGNFSFDFNPTVSVPGTKYEVSLSTTDNGQTRQQTLTLVQQ